MKTQVSIDDMQLFVCEVIDKNREEEYMEETNETADKYHETEKHYDFPWNDVNTCKLDSAREANMVPFQKCKDVTGKMPITVRLTQNKQDEANAKNRSRLVAEEFKRYNGPDFFSSTPPAEMLRHIVSRAATEKSGTSWQTTLHKRISMRPTRRQCL